MRKVWFLCCSSFVLLTSLHTQLNGKMMLKTKKRRDERTIETPFPRTKKQKEITSIITYKKRSWEKERIEGCLYDDFLTALRESFAMKGGQRNNSTIKRRKKTKIYHRSRDFLLVDFAQLILFCFLFLSLLCSCTWDTTSCSCAERLMGQKSNFLFLCPQIANKSYYKKGCLLCEISSQPLPLMGNTAEVF